MAMEIHKYTPVIFQTKGLAQPTFIIELEGKYYLTLGVWEYDPHAPDLNEEQRFQVHHLMEVFNEHKARRGVHPAVNVPDLSENNGGSTGHNNTQPTNPGKGSPGKGTSGTD